MPRTYNDLCLEARRALRATGVEASGLEARLLTAHAAGKTTEALLRDLGLYASAETEKLLAELMARRLRGEPVAYITRSWEFYGLPFEVTPDVLIPRVDSEVLAGAAIRLLGEGTGERVLDLCAGSGCIGCAVAHHARNARVVLLEASRRAAEVMKRNIAALGLGERCEAVLGDVKSPPPGSLGSFSLIVCNPPYIKRAELRRLDASVRDYEPRMALDGGEDGLVFYREILSGWKGVLRDGGSLFFEVGAGMAEDVKKLMRLHGLRSVESHTDTLGIERVITGKI